MTKFLTEYTGADGHKYGGEVEAVDWQHAEQIAAGRTPPEKVIGEHKLTIKVDADTPENRAMADRKLRELAEQNEWEQKVGLSDV